MLPKIYLIGSHRSTIIVPASKFLVSKYLPYFDATYLCYIGDAPDVYGWSAYLASIFKELTDKFVIFTLDDYLINAPVDMEVFYSALNDMENDDSTGVTKLCECTPEEHVDYPVTTQYSLWNREYLIWILEQTNSPWNFERRGSQVHNGGIPSRYLIDATITNKKSLLRTCIHYYTNSSLSGRWEGIRTDGVSEADIQVLKNLNYL